MTEKYEEMLRLEEALANIKTKIAETERAAFELAGQILVNGNPENARAGVEKYATPQEKEKLASYGWDHITLPLVDEQRRARENAEVQRKQEVED
jgi:hypothetical protein